MQEIISDKLKPADEFLVTDPKKYVKIFKSADELFPLELMTVPELFNSTVENYGNCTALMHKNLDGDEWIPITYNEYKSRVEKIAKAFIKLGLEEHGSVAVLAHNCVEWLISHLGAIYAGGNVVGIYTTNSAEAAHYILESCRANIIVVDDEHQLNKILKIKDKLPHLKAIVKISLSFGDSVDFYKWNELQTINTDDVEDEYQRRLKGIAPNACCCLVFTSGTTGSPKGAMISHDNILWNTRKTLDTLGPFKMGQNSFVSYLPLSHIAAPFVDIYISIALAGTVYFADKDALKGSLMKTLEDVRPTFFFGVPRIFEKIHEKILANLNATKGLKKSLLTWAQSVTYRYHMDHLNGKNPFPLPYMIAKYLVLDKIKATLGFDSIGILITGSAPTSLETLEFFLSLDLPLIEAYGLTESTGVMCSNTPRVMKLGSVGRCVHGIESKIINADEDGSGEICMRGRNIFMGYINEAKKTKETIDDEGWLHSGDIGFIDSDGFLHMTGRIKELIVTAGGENIPYLHIENLVRNECQAISNTFLIGDKKKFLSMLISLKTQMDSNGAPMDELSVESLHLMKELNLNYTKLSEILKAGPDAKVLTALQDAIDRANKNAISNAQKVQKFAILPNDFSLATGELNATMKLKRNFVLDKYKSVIDQFYL